MVEAPAKTLFFRTCLGVFQGGGCCAAALVGAYASAVRHGVQFIEVAGTSAGSIIAALIGAGASPDDLHDFVYQLDFKRFMRPAMANNRSFHIGIIARPLVSSFAGKTVADLISHQGMYSSLEIENWVSECLERLLPGEKKPIRFKSLVIPTAVVATDLLRREAQVWSSRETPEAEVAHAVRASCSIPLFFQPVDGRYIDGGALSNLPTFVFSRGQALSGRPLASRILAFTLHGDEPADPNAVGRPEGPAPIHPIAYLRSLASTVVAGSQELQLGMAQEVHLIPIPTGDVQATDFDKMNDKITRNLITNGSGAADAFFNDELGRVRINRVNYNIYKGSDETYTGIIENLDRSVRSIVISEETARWVYPLFPSLLLWRLDGIRIQVLLGQSGADSEKESYRRRLLRALGVEVHEIPAVPFQAYLFDPKDLDDRAVAIVRPGESADKIGVHAVRYESPVDQGVIDSLYKRLQPHLPEADPQGVPFLVKGEESGLIRALKQVPQYAVEDTDLRVDTVAISSLVSLTSYVREFKTRQIEHLYRRVLRSGLAAYEPICVQFADGQKSILTPPVVERIGQNQHALIEGSTRCTLLRNEGIKEVRCVVARNVKTPLPATRVDLKRVRIVGTTLDVGDRYDGWEYKYFRPIEAIVHSPSSLV